MITKMSGIVNRVLDEEIRLQVGPFEYQVLIPEVTRRALQERVGLEVILHTVEYLEGNQSGSRMVPRRIGFLTEDDLDFFELFCTVDKIGPKKALKAMACPVRDIARAIGSRDAAWLTTLNGVGKAGADTIIAQLHRKVARFSVMGSVTSGTGPGASVSGPLFEEAYLGMIALGLSGIEARARLDAVTAQGAQYSDVASLIQAAFHRS
jgi:Holliday junction DNA helicase RuvA